MHRVLADHLGPALTVTDRSEHLGGGDEIQDRFDHLLRAAGNRQPLVHECDASAHRRRLAPAGWGRAGGVLFRLVIDLHCHVLPNIDDGPATLEDALRLCTDVSAAGTRTVVATPHVNWEYPEVTVAVVRDRLRLLRSALDQVGIDLTVLGGAEVALSRAGDLTEDALRELRLGDGPNLLLELPWSSASTGILQAVRGLAGRGFGLVLAHPERTPMLRDRPELVRTLVEDGAYCCLNAASLAPAADRSTRSAARRLLDAGLIHAIASDSHDTVRRPPRLGALLSAVGMSDEQIDYFTVRSPAAILAGEPPETPPPVTGGGPRRWLHRLTG